MPRLAAPLVLIATLHFRHRYGASADYWGIGLAALISWVGTPGPGEATLITAGILASRHRLDIGLALFAAFVGATVGGTIGWWIGRHAGSAVLSPRLPFQRGRAWALARGERFFRRFGVLAVFLMPSWVAGILRINGSFFIPANAGSAAVWAGAWGGGAFFAGPTVTDFATDVGYAGIAAMVLLVLAVATAAVLHQRRRIKT
jgi:membrane protein DedA with SNARE-associated domain